MEKFKKLLFVLIVFGFFLHTLNTYYNQTYNLQKDISLSCYEKCGKSRVFYFSDNTSINLTPTNFSCPYKEKCLAIYEFNGTRFVFEKYVDEQDSPMRGSKFLTRILNCTGPYCKKFKNIAYFTCAFAGGSRRVHCLNESLIKDSLETVIETKNETVIYGNCSEYIEYAMSTCV